MPRLDFPVQHILLRAFRDHNHHIGYLAFVPLQSTKGVTDFFAWPVLNRVNTENDKFGAWCKTIPQTTLRELIEQNQTYIIGTIEIEKSKFHYNGLPLFAFRKEYPMGAIHFGPINTDTGNDK